MQIRWTIQARSASEWFRKHKCQPTRISVRLPNISADTRKRPVQVEVEVEVEVEVNKCHPDERSDEGFQGWPITLEMSPH